MSRVALLAAAAILATGGAAWADAPSLGLPVDCTPGEGCAVVKYMDHEPGPGIRDYACGTMTGGENDYPGTSIAIRDMAAMRKGVAVRAAAAGTVLRTREGVPDTGVYGPESRAELSAKGCGNAVVLGHGEGWTTVYCHLREGSLRVQPGQAVRAGEPIAQVGLSGLTELPHLHFQVRHNDKPVDPFTGEGRAPGSCAAGDTPLWRTDVLAALPYRPVVLRASGFAGGPIDARTAREARTSPNRFGACAPALHFWSEIIGVKAGDRVSLRVTGPDGRTVAENTGRVDRDYAQLFVQAQAPRRGADWPEGVYRGTVQLTRGTDSFTTSTSGRPEPGGC
ncbi:M23 family metallopeptidase [Azospirillum sp. RWY-5-1]|uniref:M23 family metallopeptidase n=1 Tax=Azospirillum oleiclasticum TaxID=2735135 RepID=A0ABX2TLH0_9PROT|nr:M23 family metallopeptidase [Azospirillum oleiclasticum]NYZ25168.1 M23 family metallopeptidase [Azospirillum oleiclasticum]